MHNLKSFSDGWQMSVGAFSQVFPGVIWRGYRAAIGEPSRLFRNALTAISMPDGSCLHRGAKSKIR